MTKTEELARLDAFRASMPDGYITDILDAMRGEIDASMRDDLPMFVTLAERRRSLEDDATRAIVREANCEARARFLEARAVEMEARAAGAERMLRRATEQANEAAREYHEARRAMDTLRSAFRALAVSA